MKNKQYADLFEIFEWQNNKQVVLPQVQRGFVWRPFQIENLWDSLLRGYPVGSFIFSEATEAKEAQALLDGQQRATSIGLAFNDPSKDAEYLNGKGVSIYLDLKKPEALDTREFVFRVITKSHPWGYRRESNRKPLPRANIQDAKKAFNLNEGDKYYSMSMEKFWPYDAGIPIPVYFFLQAARDKDKGIKWLQEEIYKWINKVSFTKSYVDQRSKMIEHLTKCIDSDKKFAGEDYYSLGYLLDRFSLMLRETTIPMKFLQLQFEEVERLAASDTKENENTQTEDDLDEVDQDLDDMENLFVRLNSAGTPLRGEELNYSILKSVLSPEAQDKIETACKGIISPASFISIAYRLHQHMTIKKKAALNLRVKPKEFQKAIRADKKNKEFQTSVLKDILPLLGQTHELLKYSDRCTFGLSSFMLTDLCQRAPQMIMLLMYRLGIKEDKISVGSDLQKNVVGMLTMFAWFARGSKSNYDQLLNNIRPCLETSPKDLFWSAHTVNYAQLETHDNRVEMAVMTKRAVKETVTRLTDDYRRNSQNGTIAKLSSSEKSFFRRGFFDRSLILYAQREYFESEFPAIEFELDDTNVPFDWDHISPQDLVKKNKGISRALNDWYQSNGNFRALSFSKNRARGATPPSEDLDKISAAQSFCNLKAWQCHVFRREDLKGNQKNQIVVYELILNRGFQIYEEWYDKLNIGELLKAPAMTLEVFQGALTKKWSSKDGEYNLTTNSGQGIYVYFDGEGDERFHANTTEIGVWMLDEKKLKAIALKGQSVVLTEDELSYVATVDTTYVHDSPEMVTKLFQELVDFLGGFEENFRMEALKCLKANLKANIADKILWPEIHFKDSA
jgi:hypothetical protein